MREGGRGVTLCTVQNEGRTMSSMMTMGMRPLSPVRWDLPHPQSQFSVVRSVNTSPDSILGGRGGV